MHVVVLVPWRPSADRIPPWKFVISHLEALGYPVITADSTGPVFSLAEAFNRAASGPWDRAILSEADVFVPHEQIHQALELPGLVWCFDRQLRLDRRETARFLATGDLPTRPADPSASALGSNGVRVIDRDLWDQVGGYDERFVGWGAEDNDFAWRVLDSGAQTTRIDGQQVELWHSRDPEYFAGRSANRALLAEKHPGRYP